MPGALTGALRILGPLAPIGRPSGAPALLRPAAVSPAVSVPVLVVAAPASMAAIPVSTSFPGPSAALIPLGLPAGIAPASSLAVSSAVAPVAGATVLAASAAASALAPSAVGANGCEPAGGPLLTNVPRQTDEGIV